MRDQRMAAAALVVSLLSMVATAGQTYWSYVQVRDLREQFEMSGPQLTFQAQVQFHFNDERPAPANADGRTRPVVTSRDFETYDEVFVRVKLENVGRLETNLLGARLQIGPQAWVTHRSREVNGAVTWCEISGGESVDCTDAFPVTIRPGVGYHLWFPLKGYRDQINQPVSDEGLAVEIRATGLPRPEQLFSTGVSVQL